jgi:hypothetical protein
MNNEKVMPLGVILDETKDEITREIIKIQKERGIPSYLLDFIVSGILADIRDLKSREYVAEITKEEENGGYNAAVEQNT